MKKTLLLFLLLPFIGFCQALSGNYYINSSRPDGGIYFNTLASAVNSLNTNGISGPVVFLLETSQTLSSQIVINPILAGSGGKVASSLTNTVTIKPAPGATISITGGQVNTVTSLLKLNGADFIIIDGSNIANGTTKDLTFKSTANTDNNQESIIWVASNNTNGADNNTFKNIIFTGQSTSSNGSVENGIVFANTSSTVDNESISNSNNLIQNNTFLKIRYAVNVKGNSTTYSRNLTVDNNTFGETGSEILINAIRIQNGKNYIISGNKILAMTRASNSNLLCGISLEGNSDVGVVSKNIIQNISITVSGRATGILVDLNTNNNAKLTISNNFITNIKTNDSNVWDSNNSSSGIFISKGKEINIYYNTVSLNESQSGFSSALILTSGSILNIRNNIFSNTNTFGFKYALYSAVAKSDYSDINYNNYNTNGAYLALIGGQLTTLAQLQGGTGKDANSKNTTPVFLASNDYHLDSANTANNGLLIGTPIADVTTDLDEDTRTKPYMGADEINSCTAPVITTHPTSFSVCEGQSGAFNVATSATGVTYQWQYSSDGSTGWIDTDGTQDVSDHKTATLRLTNIPMSYSGYYVRCIVSKSATCFTYSNTARLTVNAKIVPSVTIEHDQSSLTICQGTHVRFTAKPVNGGTTPTYKWYNGTNLLAETSNSYLAYNLKSTDDIKVVMTSNATGCISTPPTATSNSFAFTVITTDRGRTHGGRPICYGTQPNKVTLANFDEYKNDEPYSYKDKIIRWEYKDGDPNDTRPYIPIDHTEKLIEYQPTELLYANRSYRAVAKTDNCDVLEAAVQTTFTIKPLPVATFTAEPGANACTNTDVTYTTESGQTDYVWTIPGTLNTDYSIAGGVIPNSNSITFKWLTTGSKTVTISYTSSNGCKAIAKSSTSTNVQSRTAAPTVGTTVGIGCSTLGSVTLTGLPSGNWIITQSGTANNTYENIGTTKTQYTVNGLALGTYYFTVSNGGSCSSVQSAPVNIKDETSTEWNGTSWLGGPPSATKNLIISSVTPNQPFTSNVSACSLTITSAGDVIIPSGVTLTVTNAVKSNGKLVFENNSSLMQDNSAVNTGNITYRRIAPKIRQADFVYWSSPVANQKLIDVSPTTRSDMFYYNNAPGWIEINPNNPMIVGKGYIIRGPEGFSNSAKTDYPASFIGVPNNGTIYSESLTSGKYHLIGNPYPSALSIDALIAGNTVLNGTIYLWTHNTAVNPTGNYDYNQADYASYNTTGSVKGIIAATGNQANASERPTGFIGAGQAFFVSTRLPGQVLFNNGMRSAGTNNSQFFKSTSKEATIEKNRVWLNLTSAKGQGKQLLVGYIEGASNAYENRFDGVSFDGNPSLDFYSMINANKFVIQGRALPFVDTDIVPLGYRTAVEDTFTIAIDETDGKLSNQKIYIEDKKTGEIHDLTTSNYTFTSTAGAFTDRFVLRYTGKTLGTGDFENLENGILVSVKNKVVSIISSKENIKEVNVYDISGKLLYNKKKIGSTELQIQNLQSSNQVLLVKVILENDFVTTKKIIFN